jgi:hypothetical protein
VDRSPEPVEKSGETSPASPDPYRRRELLKELRGAVKDAREGDEEALSRVRRVLKEAPDLGRIFRDLSTQAEQSLIERITASDPLSREMLPPQLDAMRSELAGPEPSMLERLLSERIVACWLQLQYAEVLYAQNLGKLSITQSEYQQRRLDRFHRRYLSSIKSLAQIRKMGPTVQINIAEQQINRAG